MKIIVPATKVLMGPGFLTLIVVAVTISRDSGLKAMDVISAGQWITVMNLCLMKLSKLFRLPDV